MCSCASLHPGQINAVEKYASATKGIFTKPAEMYSRMYQLRSQAQALQLSGVLATNQTAEQSIKDLQENLIDKLKFLDLVDSFAYAYRIVGKYADLVKALVNESYLNEFAKNKKEWQSSFDGLVKTYNESATKRVPPPTKIPASVGSVAADIIRQIGSAKMKALQKKYLSAAISAARIPLEGICDDFLQVDIPKIEKEIASLPDFINENYKDFLNNVNAYEDKQGNNPYNYYKHYIPIYLNWQIELREMQTLVTKLKTCMQSLKNSYGILDEYIKTESPNKDIPAEIVQLDAAYSSLMSTVEKFSDAKERIFKITY